jgi:hypothetical protein
MLAMNFQPCVLRSEPSLSFRLARKKPMSGRKEEAIDGGLMMDDRDHIPLPLDHFFFCFLPPVDAAGA